MSRFKRKKAEAGVSLEERVAGGASSAYEALQLQKSKINRLRVCKKYDEALTMTCQAAKLQLQFKYENSGNELGTLFVDILRESELGLTPEYRNCINDVSNSFDNVPGLGVSFMKECINLSKDLGPRQFGDEILHRQLALKLWQLDDEKSDKGEEERMYKATAVLHFAMGEAPGSLWSQIIEDPSMDPTVATWSGEVRREQMVLLGVLFFLSLENVRDANELFRMFKKYRKEKGVKKETLTYEFMDRLLLTSVRDAGPLFKELIEAYRPQLSFHPAVLQLLQDPIAKKIFRIQAPPSVMSMIANMFG